MIVDALLYNLIEYSWKTVASNIKLHLYKTSNREWVYELGTNKYLGMTRSKI